MCLPSSCLETGCINPSFYSCGRYLATTDVYSHRLATGPYATIHFILTLLLVEGFLSFSRIYVHCSVHLTLKYTNLKTILRGHSAWIGANSHWKWCTFVIHPAAIVGRQGIFGTRGKFPHDAIFYYILLTLACSAARQLTRECLQTGKSGSELWPNISCDQWWLLFSNVYMI
jgi:hypothetical protein